MIKRIYYRRKNIKNSLVLKLDYKQKIELTEDSFHMQLPQYLQLRSRRFFTPIHVAQTAAQWLTEDGRKRILDIGAGVGKFCIAGAKHSDSHFFGIEHRPSLAKIANDLIIKYNVSNAVVQCGDVIEIDFADFDAFYMYNPFFENLVPSLRLNNEVELAMPLYTYYFKKTEEKLSRTKPGTRLVTYHGNNFEIPATFKKMKEGSDGNLKLWIKE